MNKINKKENTNKNRKRIANPIYVKPRGRLPQKRYKSSLAQQHTSGTSATSELRTPLENVNQNILTDEFSTRNEQNNSRQMKKCGRCKQYAMHNRRTCNVDLSNLQCN